MRAIVLEALRAGALGFSTSRTMGHRAIDGELVPGTYAAEDELFGIGSRAGRGRTPASSSWRPSGSAGEMLEDAWQEVDWMRRLSAAIDRPVSFALLQVDDDPELWRKQLAASLEACAEGAELFPQIAGRPTGFLTGHHTTLCLFSDIPAYVELRARHLAGARARGGAGRPRGAALDRVVDAVVAGRGRGDGARRTSAPSCSATRPTTSRDRSARWPGWPRPAACRRWRWPTTRWPATAGHGLLYLPILNYATGDLDHVHEMLLHPQGLLGLSDGGAHTGTICDASMPTFMLTHWTRDRSAGRHAAARVRGEEADARHGPPLRHVGPRHGGARRAGRLQPHRLRRALRSARRSCANDLPAGGRRLLQKASGYVATIKTGTVTFEHGEPTGELPGPPGARRPLSPPAPAATAARAGPPARQTASRMEAPLTQYALRDGIHIGYQVWGRDGVAGHRRRARVQQRAHDLHRRDRRRAQLAALHRAGRRRSPA